MYIHTYKHTRRLSTFMAGTSVEPQLWKSVYYEVDKSASLYYTVCVMEKFPFCFVSVPVPFTTVYVYVCVVLPFRLCTVKRFQLLVLQHRIPIGVQQQSSRTIIMHRRYRTSLAARTRVSSLPVAVHTSKHCFPREFAVGLYLWPRS